MRYFIGAVLAGLYTLGFAAVSDTTPLVGIILGICGFFAFIFAGAYFPIFNWVAFPLSAYIAMPPNTPVFYLGIGLGVGSLGIFLLTQFRPVVSNG